MQKEKPNFYAVLEADVRYDNRLSSTAKVIHAEITALTNKSGYCWATNKYFADNFGISESQVSRIISQLASLGYVDLEIKDDYKRKLTLRKKRKGGTQKAQTPPTQKCVYNNTSINNKINNMDAEASDSQIKSKLSKKPVNNNPLSKALYDCIREWKLPVRNHANLRKKLSEIKGLYSEELLIDYFSTLSENPFLFSKDEPFQPTVNDGVDLISKIVQIRRCAQKEMVDEGGNISLTKIWG